ncbi:unannotated protein [freshwater metagenome]|uniref:Unannotated protein n=1 Tax=freshwater metagenome TaxID=449393 RepID=A0A6J7HWL5_9ZZZZ
MLKELSRLGETGFKHHFPHVAMDMVNPGAARPSSPNGSEERHAVPDFDDPITWAEASEQLAYHRGRKDHKAAMFANDSIAVARSLVGMALGV